MTTNDWVAKPHMSDDAVVHATGRSWGQWVDVLDAWGAMERPHAEIARHVAEEHGVDGWWAQSVTVGYERIRGRRKANERPDGFSMSVSKTLPVPVSELFDWFIDGARRVEWLGADLLRVRTASPLKSGRFDVADGSGILAAYFTDRGERSSVQLQLNGLPDEATLQARKRQWKSRLDALAHRLRA